MTQPKVAVTGFGIISPLGRGAEENSAGLRSGKSGIVSMRPEWEEKKLRSHVAGKIDADALRDTFDRKQNRFLAETALLSCVALKDAIEHSGLSQDDVRHPRTGAVVGSGASTSMPDIVTLSQNLDRRGGSKVGAYQVPKIMGSSISANVGSLFGIRGHSYSVTSACSTSAHAIMMGLDLIRSGRQDRVFVGGSEDVHVLSACTFDGMNALSSAYNDTPERASRPLDKGRDGFVFSGGGGVMVLENLELAKARGAKVHALLQGAAATCDGDDMVVPNGTGATEVMNLALQDAGVPADRIDYINLHGTSTPVGDIKEIESMLSVFGKGIPSFSSSKSQIGHALGAAGVIESIFCVLMMEDGFLAPNINLEDPEDIIKDLPVVRETQKAEAGWVLSNSFGFGGTNCALIFSRPDAS